MHIGHYTTGCWLPGGIGSYLRRLSAAQREAGHDVMLIDRLDAPGEPPEGSADAVRIADDDELFELARREQLDILHVHTLVKPPAHATVPVLRTLHGHEPYCPSGSRFLGRWHKPCDRAYSLMGCAWGHLIDHCGSVRPAAMAAEFGRARDEMRHTRGMNVITVSQYLRQQMLRSGYDPSRLRALPLPAPRATESAPPPRQGPARFVFLGRLSPQKGVDWLLRAMALTRQDARLDIAGEGNAEPSLRKLAAKLALGDRLTFHGWIQPAAAQRLLGEARALVLPSLWQEPAGLVSFEAAACGRAVIASNVGGVSEMVFHDQTGLLIEPGNDGRLARAIDLLASDYELALRLGTDAQALIPRQFSMANHLAVLDEIYAITRAGAHFGAASTALANEGR
jgi:glycosyltransferase involved in cell wall biosynthesis